MLALNAVVLDHHRGMLFGGLFFYTHASILLNRSFYR